MKFKVGDRVMCSPLDDEWDYCMMIVTATADGSTFTDGCVKVRTPDGSYNEWWPTGFVEPYSPLKILAEQAKDTE